MSIQHTILTNFNVNLYAEPRILHPHRWVDYRTDIFERFTVPSVQAQTHKDFTWVIRVDKNTPKSQRKRIVELVESANGIVTHDDPVKYLTPDKDKYIFTILDNDDAIPIQYIGQVQDNVHIYAPPFLMDLSLVFRVAHDFSRYQVMYQHIRRLKEPRLACEMFSVVLGRPRIPSHCHGDTYRIYPRYRIIQNAGVQIIHEANMCTGFNTLDVLSPVMIQFPPRLFHQYGWKHTVMLRRINNTPEKP